MGSVSFQQKRIRTLYCIAYCSSQQYWNISEPVWGIDLLHSCAWLPSPKRSPGSCPTQREPPKLGINTWNCYNSISRWEQKILAPIFFYNAELQVSSLKWRQGYNSAISEGIWIFQLMDTPFGYIQYIVYGFIWPENIVPVWRSGADKQSLRLEQHVAKALPLFQQ